MNLRLIVIIPLFCFTILSHAQAPDKEVFAERRAKLMEIASDGIIVMLSGIVYERNSDVNYDFRQSSNFYYLSGFEEPKSALIIDPSGANKYTLFVQPKNPQTEIWDGYLTGVDNAVKDYGADRSYDIKEFDKKLAEYVNDNKKLYIIKSDDLLNKKISAINPKAPLADLSVILDEMRIIKSPYEILQLQKAIDITCLSIIECMKNAKPGMYEYQIEALLEYNFKSLGSQVVGFPSIVGSGPNTTTLHYETNMRMTENGDLIVMDVGAEYNFYTADVTRTFPVNGKFSFEQKLIYSIVLAAQKKGIEFIKPGVKFYQVDSVARDVVKKGLVNLGLLDESENVRKFFMHGTSHWLGMDVHDVGNYSSPGGKSDRILEPGMVLTVEPGIYIAEGTAGVDPKYYNIGVRIEDDILVTETGYQNLSSLAPKEVNEIESLMKK